MQAPARGLLYVRMTEVIDPPPIAEPARYFDKRDHEISLAQWEVLRRDPSYRQFRITNITGLRPGGGWVYIRVHTVWTGVRQVCAPPCAGAHLYMTRVFDSCDYLLSLEDWHYNLEIPWPWRDADEAIEGHDALVRKIQPRMLLGEAHFDEGPTPTLDLKRLYEQRITPGRHTTLTDTHSRAAAS